MACCKGVCKTMAAPAELAAAQEELMASAQGFGFDMTWITNLINQYGSDVLSLVVEAVRTGFTRDFVVELLTKFGPIVLNLLMQLINEKRMQVVAEGAALPNIMTDESGLMVIMIEKFLPQIMNKVLPILLDKYGNDFVKAIVDAILQSLQPKLT